MAVAILPALTERRCRVRDANVLGLEKKLGKTVCSTDYPDSLDCLSIILNLSISVFFTFSRFPLFSCWFRTVD